MTGSTPKKGTVADPGLVSMAPGNGVTMMDPVSVCQKVSTMAHCFLPTWSLYQCQASGLIGSPTVPNTRRVLRSWGLGVVFTETTEETDGGGSGVEVGNLVLLDGLPVTGWGRVNGGGFEDGGGDTIEKRSVDDVTDETCEIEGCAGGKRETYV
jgi:hypothetical protein